MANQNFRVKKGLEVGLGATFLYADDIGVGINSAVPRSNLDVRGEAIIENQLSVGVGVGTTAPGLTVTGLSTFNGNMIIDGDVSITGDLNFDDAFIDELNFNVGIGTSLTVGFISATDGTIGGAGIATVGGDPQFNSISVATTSTFGGIATFQSDVSIAGTVTVGGDIVLDDLTAGNIQVGGTVFTEGLDFNVGIGTTLTVQDLSVTGIASINGAGIATIGGDPEFNSLLVTGISSFAGVSTFGSDVSIAGTVTVGGDIVLDDLEAGNITVGGTIFTNGLDFNVGIGTSLSLEELTVDEAGIGTAGIGSLTVSGISSFVGFVTFGGDVSVAGTISVGGDIVLDDLESGSIKTNEIDFNVGIGSTLIVTGISSLNIITGIGSELQYLPPASVSTGDTIGVGSLPPTIRPTGEPLEGGDLWFDPVGLRQYTYYVGVGTTNGAWVDSNPPPIQPALTFQGDEGGVGQVDISTGVFELIGVDDQIVTQTGTGRTVYIGLTTDVEITNNLSVGNSISASKADITGSVVMQGAVIGVASITNLNVTGVAVTDLVVTNGTITNLEFTTGVGTNLTVKNLDVTGIATLNGAGIATLGGVADFESLRVTGFTTLGFTTVQNTLWVAGDLNIGGDFIADELDVRRLEVSEDTVLNELNYNVGVGSTLSVVNQISAGASITAADGLYSDTTLDVEGNSTFVGVVTTRGDLFVGVDLSVGNDLDVVNNLTAAQVTSSNIFSNNLLSYNNATGSTLTVNDVLTSNGQAGFTTANVSTILEVTGVSSFIGTMGFSTATGYDLTVTDLVATGSVSLPGIPVQGGDVNFRNIDISGISTFAGLSTFQSDVYINGDLFINGNQSFIDIDGTNINLSGIGTIPNLVSTAATITDLDFNAGVGTDLALETLRVSVAATVADLDVTTDVVVGRNLSVAGLSTFTGLVELSDVNVGSALTTVDLNVTGTANISGAGIATEGGDATFNSVTTTAGADVGTDLTVGGSATVTGQVVANGVGIGLTVANDAYVGGALTVDGDLNVTGDISYDEVTGRNLNISGVGTITNLVSTASTTEVLTVNTHADMGSINASGIATVGVITAPVGTVEILDFTTATGGSLTLSGNIVATGDVTAKDVVAQQLSVSGVSTVNSLEVTTSIDAASITVTGTSSLDYVTTADALVGSALTVTGDLTVGGNLDITGDIEFDEISGVNLNITGVSTTRTLIVQEDASVNRNFSVSGIATVGQLEANSLQVVGSAEIDTDLNVDRNLVVGAAATVTNDLTVNEDLIVARNASITGIVTAQDIDTLSDSRYKENITGISSALYKVTQLNGVTFNWVGETTISGGVIAQDVEAVLPEFVHNEDPKTVNYNGIIGALVEAVKELKAENDNLRNRVENLENP